MFKIQAVCRLHLVAVLQVIIQRLQSYLPFSELLFLNTACIVQTCKKKKMCKRVNRKHSSPLLSAITVVQSDFVIIKWDIKKLYQKVKFPNEIPIRFKVQYMQ